MHLRDRGAAVFRHANEAGAQAHAWTGLIGFDYSQRWIFCYA
jgi:hypothetical protein